MKLFGIIVLILLLGAPSLADTLSVWHDGFAPPPTSLGLNGDPRALLHTSDGSLYVGGSFNLAGPLTTWYVARLDQDTGAFSWTSVGDLDNRVDALAAWGDSVLVGGRFTDAAGVAVNRVAVWDGALWHPVGAPAAWTWGHVLSLVIHDGVPWAAGSGFVVRWTGTAWEAVTGTFSGDIFALASYGDELYAGGAFSSITDPAQTSTPADNIVRWNGSWQAVDSGLNGTCYALAPWDGKLVVGGVFSAPDNLLATWDGTFWNSAGPALIGNFVTAIESMGSRLFVGGDLFSAGGYAVQNIAQFHSDTWWDLDGGVNGMVRAISTDGSVVVVGGSFTMAGEVASSHIGIWIDPSVAVEPAPTFPVIVDDPYPNPFNPLTTLCFHLEKRAEVTVTIHALDGSLLAVPLATHLPAGDHRAVWSGCNQDGRALASGVYVMRLHCGDVVESRRVQLLK